MLLSKNPRGTSLMIKYSQENYIQINPRANTPISYMLGHTAQSHTKLADFVSEAHLLLSVMEKHWDKMVTQTDVYGRLSISFEPIRDFLTKNGWEEFGNDWKKMAAPKKEKKVEQTPEKTTSLSEGPASEWSFDWMKEHYPALHDYMKMHHRNEQE